MCASHFHSDVQRNFVPIPIRKSKKGDVFWNTVYNSAKLTFD